jgi:hypothetical protein
MLAKGETSPKGSPRGSGPGRPQGARSSSMPTTSDLDCFELCEDQPASGADPPADEVMLGTRM